MLLIIAAATGCSASSPRSASPGTLPPTTDEAAASTSTSSSAANSISSTTAYATTGTTSAVAARPCTSDRLAASASLGSGAGGHEAVVFVVTNAGAEACTIDGYPAAVWFVDPQGDRVPGDDVEQAVPPPTVVTLQPGSPAATTIWTANPGFSSSPEDCQPRSATRVDVILPHESTAISAAVQLTVCSSNLDQIDTVGTTPFTAGTSENGI